MRYYPGHFGPAGGLVTYANQPIQPLRYVSMAEVSRQLGRRKLLKNRALGCAHKGMLITRVGGVTTANVHLSPNHFETWAQGNGAEEVQTAQMAIVTREVCALSAAKRLAVFGDFNIVKSCQLHRRLIDTGLIDPFGDEGTCSARTGEHSFDWMMFGGQVGLPRVTYPTVLYARERLPAAFIWAAPISDHSPLVADADW
jgi:endonuclease/exonuclease/phosphatase family metal-dependent hydrolase